MASLIPSPWGDGCPLVGAVEGERFDGGFDAFERVLQLSDIPLTRAPIASGHPSPRGEGVLRQAPVYPDENRERDLMGQSRGLIL